MGCQCIFATIFLAVYHVPSAHYAPVVRSFSSQFRLRLTMSEHEPTVAASTRSNYVISMETVPISIMSLRMKLSAVTLTEGPTGICISAGLQQFENDDYAECAFLWLVITTSAISITKWVDPKFCEDMKTTLCVFPHETPHVFSERNWAHCWKHQLTNNYIIHNHEYNRILLYCFLNEKYIDSISKFSFSSARMKSIFIRYDH